MGDGGRPRRGDPARRGARRRRRAPAGADRAHRRSDRRDGRGGAGEAGVAEIAAVGTAGLRIASNSATFLTASANGLASTSRSSPARRRAASRTSRSRRLSTSETASLVVFDTGGGSSQFTFGRGDRVDEQFSVNVGAVAFTERFGLDGAVDEQTARRGAGRDRRRSRPARRPARARRRRRHGRRGDEPRGRQARAGDLRSERDPGRRLDAAEVDRQIELYRTRTADERRDDRRPPAQARGGDPRRRLHRAHGARRARPGRSP